jgi:hypothetical protein
VVRSAKFQPNRSKLDVFTWIIYHAPAVTVSGVLKLESEGRLLGDQCDVVPNFSPITGKANQIHFSDDSNTRRAP